METPRPIAVLPAALRLGAAELVVSDLSRSVAFYERAIGLRLIDRAGGRAELGGEGGAPVLRLVERPGAKPAAAEASGLFHVAILLPERRDLAVAFARLAKAGLLTGASDHLVSEAIYLDDPDGNGLEIYRDRAKDEWPIVDGRIAMATEPIDRAGLSALLGPDGDLDRPAPAGAVVGHVHLKVGDLEAARAFWIDALGFEQTTAFPGALFMSAGGYHHHVAANVWRSRGRGPAPDDHVGTVAFEAILPDGADVEVLRERLPAAGRSFEMRDGAVAVADPWGSRILFRAA